MVIFCFLEQFLYMSYLLTIGLEIHLKVKSATKLFCACTNSQDMEMLVPNTNICPVCTGQPGALPVLQYETMMKSLLMGRALKCDIHEVSRFDRKSYFYPDLPMGYQITQFHSPTMTDGQVSFFNEDFSANETIGIQQIQMETDTAKSIHTEWSSLIDYNRSSTPLIEIVTKPDFHNAEQVAAFLKELQRIARYNDISDADMEKGQMRVDVNISISKDENRGIRNEIKNMNSISAIIRAIEHEYNRQVQVLESGGTIEQATRRWDDIAGESFVMRSKEDALDYRYFPEPDLPPLTITREIMDEIDESPLLLPSVFITRCREEFGFHKEYINALINDKETLDYFLACLDDWCDPKETVKRIAWPMLAYTKEQFLTLWELKFDRSTFVSFLRFIAEWNLINNQYKLIMEQMIATGKSPEEVVKELWFDQVSNNDDEIIAVVQQVIANNPWVVEQYKWWKETTIGFFVGQVMKALAGKIDPNKAKELLEIELHRDM